MFPQINTIRDTSSMSRLFSKASQLVCDCNCRVSYKYYTVYQTQCYTMYQANPFLVERITFLSIIIMVELRYFRGSMRGSVHTPQILHITDCENWSITEGAESHYFSGIDIYQDFLRLKIKLNQNIMHFDRH